MGDILLWQTVGEFLLVVLALRKRQGMQTRAAGGTTHPASQRQNHRGSVLDGSASAEEAKGSLHWTPLGKGHLWVGGGGGSGGGGGKGSAGTQPQGGRGGAGAQAAPTGKPHPTGPPAGQEGRAGRPIGGGAPAPPLEKPLQQGDRAGP